MLEKIGIAIVLCGMVLAVGSFCVVAASLAFAGYIPSPSGPVGKAAVIGLIVAVCGLAVLLGQMLVFEMRRS